MLSRLTISAATSEGVFEFFSCLNASLPISLNVSFALPPYECEAGLTSRFAAQTVRR